MYPLWAINRLENNRKGHQFSLPQDRQKKHYFETLLVKFDTPKSSLGLTGLFFKVKLRL